VLGDPPQGVPEPIFVFVAAKLAGGLSEGRDLRFGRLILLSFFHGISACG
jgi:hypothetical protein